MQAVSKASGKRIGVVEGERRACNNDSLQASSLLGQLQEDWGSGGRKEGLPASKLSFRSAAEG